MAWKVYKAIFEAKSPIHIGAQRIGMIQRTRHYIPAMSFWGALTSRLTRALYQSPESSDYQNVGKFCHAHLLSSYFFPFSNELAEGVLIPKYCKGKWVYGQNTSEAKFEARHLAGYGSTAIESKSTAAEEASLHEIQFILPRIRNEDVVMPVYFWGYLFAREGEYCGCLRLECEDDDILVSDRGEKVSISKLLGFVQVGGERTYGYGRLALMPDRFRQTIEKLWGIYAVKTSEERPQLTIPDENPIPAHLRIPNGDKCHIEGAIEAMVSRQWKSDGGAGEHPTSFGACFVPGSIAGCETKTSVGCYGILKVKEG